MAIRKDFLLVNNVLVIKNNDLVISESDNQHVGDIINSFAGWFKEFPTMGCGALQYINAPFADIQKLESTVKQQLLADGYDNKKIKIGAFTTDTQEINIYDQS